MRNNNLGFGDSSSSAAISNRNFNRMLDEINLNLQNFPLTSSTTAAIIAGQNNSNSSSNNNNNPAQINSNQPESYFNQRFAQGPFGQSQQSNHRNREAEVFNRLEGIGRIRDGEGSLRNQENSHNCREERKKQNSSPKIGDILTCFICLGKLKNAHMCPDCQKMCCEGCIKEWLLNKSQCPHCRSHLRPSKLMKCRFVGEITSALEKIEQIELRKEKQGICPEHDNQLQYYCQMCKHPVCSDCGMIGTKHKNHKFEKLNTVYDAHVSLVQNQLERLFSKLKELNKQQKEIDEVIKGIDSQRSEKEADVEKLMTYMTMKLQEKHKNKIEQLRILREPVQEEIDLLENMSEEINHHIETMPKSTLISKSSEIISTLEEINDRRVLKTNFSDADKKLDFESEVIPPYDSAVFFLQNYTVKRKSSNVAYSDSLCVNGNEWRLKVYLNGNDKAKEKYLSVFIEMTKGQIKPSNFEYRIEMVNQINRNINEARECVIQFEAGACWGYDKFFDLSNLESAGFLLPESDMLIIKYQVRYASYYEFNLASQCRITELLAENEQLKIQSKNIDTKKWMDEVDLSEVRSINQIKQTLKEDFNENSQNEDEEEHSFSKDHKVAVVDESKTENVDIENLMRAFDDNKEVNMSNQPGNDRTSDQEQSENEENDNEEEAKMDEDQDEEEHHSEENNYAHENDPREQLDDADEDNYDLNEGCGDQQSSLDQHQKGSDQFDEFDFNYRAAAQESLSQNEFKHNSAQINNQFSLASNSNSNALLQQQKSQEIASILKGNSNVCANQMGPREEEDDDISPELYSCLDEIGDKVNFINPNDAQLYSSQLSVNLKKNLLPEFEVEAHRMSFENRQIEKRMNKNEIKQAGEREQEFQLSKVSSSKQDGLSSSTSTSKREEATVSQKIDRLFTQQYSSHYQFGAANLPLDGQQNKFQSNVTEKSEAQQFKKITAPSSKQITNSRLQDFNVPNEQLTQESQEDNKDDSLLIMERKIEKLELLSKLEDQQSQSQLKQQQQLLQKGQQYQSQSNTVLPSQSSLVEARKQLISSISFPDDLIKKINKIKAQGTSVPTIKAEVPSVKPSTLISQIDVSKNAQPIGQSLLPPSVFEEKEKIITKSPISTEQAMDVQLSKKKLEKVEETNPNSLSTQSKRQEQD